MIMGSINDSLDGWKPEIMICWKYGIFADRIDQSKTPICLNLKITKVKLGRGTFGEVYRCYCYRNQRNFAVKKIFVSSQDQKQYEDKIYCEFNIAKKFNHTNIGPPF